MRKTVYKNGREEVSGDARKAKEILLRKGILQTLGNWGPHTPNKDDLYHRVVETFTDSGYQFTVIEIETMSMGADFQTVSARHKQKWAWYMPV